MINCTRTQILSRAPCGLQKDIEGQGMDLHVGNRGAARGLVSLSASRPR